MNDSQFKSQGKSKKKNKQFKRQSKSNIRQQIREMQYLDENELLDYDIEDERIIDNYYKYE